ncbi:MAG TPA: hypothetical protein VD735_03595 [Candidatus Saccharimonadales bacterium]|nr:hypothetical protein [Candidatus Saccharimonadales bacterium]
MKNPDVSATVYAMAREMAATYTGDYVPPTPDDYSNLSPEQVATECYGLYENAAERLMYGARDLPHYRYALTRKVQAERSSMPISSAVLRGCFQFETRLARCLDRQEDPNHIYDRNRLPAMVLADDDGPFAYQKGDGFSGVVAWRAGTLTTQAGKRAIPAGSIFDMVYGWLKDNDAPYWEEDPRKALLGSKYNTGLAVLRMASMPDDAHFLRFTTQYLPPRVRRVVAHDAADLVEKKHPNASFRSYAEAGMRLTALQLERRVGALLRTGRAVTL